MEQENMNNMNKKVRALETIVPLITAGKEYPVLDEIENDYYIPIGADSSRSAWVDKKHFFEVEHASETKEKIKAAIANLQEQLEILDKLDLEPAYELLHEFRNWNREWDLAIGQNPENADEFVKSLSQKYNITKK